MIGSKKIILLACLTLLLYSNSFAQLAACANVELGPDTTLSCNSSCITIESDITEVGVTNSYSISSINYAPPYPFNQGTPIIVGYDDVWSEIIPLPFTFCFFGDTYDKIVIGANGVITFDTTLASPPGFNWFTASQCDWPFSQSIPNSTGLPYRNTINGAYHDINPEFFGAISIDTLGSYPCRTFVVNYNEVPHFDCSNITTTQQIVLYETTNIIEVYIQDKPTCSSWNNGNAVIGIQNATGTVGYTPPVRNTGPWSTNNEAWRFSPDGSATYSIEWFDNSGNILGNNDTLVVCPSVTTTYSANVTYDICDGTQVVVTDDITVSEDTCIVTQCQPINNFSVLGTIQGCCYYVSNDTMSWTNANALCSISGGDMVAINSQLELDSLNILLGNDSTPPFGPNAHWLAIEDGTSYWNNGDSLTLTNYDGSYSLFSNGNYMYIQTNGLWDNSDNAGTQVPNGIYAVMEICPPNLGCTDSNAINFDASADIDDGSCTYCNNDTTYTNITSCDSVLWNGNWYNTSGIYDTTFTDAGSNTKNIQSNGNEGNIWYFGENAGIDFNSGSAVAITDGELNTLEGCATICDNNGDLLFYTDGVTVYNRTHDIMPNGTNLDGDPSSSQSAIVVKKPGNNTIYCIFTVDHIGGPLKYSEVDMSLDGGSGEVNGVKNDPILNSACEKIASIQHQNGVDYWIIAHEDNSDRFYSYLLTSNGWSPGTSYSVGSNVDHVIGYLRASSDGTKLAAARYMQNVELFNFDNNTGAITFEMILLSYSGTPQTFYGLEFSPNSNLLYVSNVDYFNADLYQFNLAAGSHQDIINSKTVIGTMPQNGGALQIAPDGKIYNAQGYSISGSSFGSDFLGVINYPNLVGTFCDYNSDAFHLAGKQSKHGLPTFYSSIFSAPPSGCDSVVVLSLNINPSTNSILTVSSCDTYFWNGNTYDSSGTYSYISTNINGCDSTATLNLIINSSSTSTSNISECDSYSWNGTLYTSSGTYNYTTANVYGCDSTVTLNLTIVNCNTSCSLLCNTDFEDTIVISLNNQAFFNETVIDCWETTASDSLIEVWSSGFLGFNAFSGIQFIEINATMFSTLFQDFYISPASDITISFAHRGRDGVDSIRVSIGPVGGPYTILGEFGSPNTNWEYYTIPNYTTQMGSNYLSLRFEAISTASPLIGTGNFLDAISINLLSPNITINNISNNVCFGDSLGLLDISAYSNYNPCQYSVDNGSSWQNIGIFDSLASGNYFITILDDIGCESDTNLTIVDPIILQRSDTVIACNAYTWVNGVTYTASNNIATYTYMSTLGCDSIVTLDLTINYSDSGVDSQVRCNSFTWVDGNTYTSSNNSATYIYTNILGCDSVITLDLIINQSTSSVYTVISCDSYTWPINGQNYTSSGNYSFLTNNSNGCDSTAILNLTINNITSSNTSLNSCVPVTWNGQTYSSSGNYSFLTSNTNGCDSIINLSLTIENKPVTTNISVSACISYYWNGINYENSGVYSYMTANNLGCDSTTILTLDIFNYDDIYIPNTFTPNSDNINDQFVINNNLTEFKMWIFNRWGEEIFYTEDNQLGWNGEYENRICQDGLYVWRIVYICGDILQEEVGYIFLLR